MSQNDVTYFESDPQVRSELKSLTFRQNFDDLDRFDVFMTSIRVGFLSLNI